MELLLDSFRETLPDLDPSVLSSGRDVTTEEASFIDTVCAEWGMDRVDNWNGLAPAVFKYLKLNELVLADVKLDALFTALETLHPTGELTFHAEVPRPNNHKHGQFPLKQKVGQRP